jgi:hypothetical protein
MRTVKSKLFFALIILALLGVLFASPAEAGKIKWRQPPHRGVWTFAATVTTGPFVLWLMISNASNPAILRTCISGGRGKMTTKATLNKFT